MRASRAPCALAVSSEIGFAIRSKPLDGLCRLGNLTVNVDAAGVGERIEDVKGQAIALVESKPSHYQIAEQFLGVWAEDVLLRDARLDRLSLFSSRDDVDPSRCFL